MTKGLFTKTLGGTLAPSDAVASGFMDRMKVGESAWLDKSRARNPRRHRLFWALVEICRENTDTNLSKEAWGDFLKVLGGHVEVAKRRNGDVVYIPKSIAWSRMSETEFKEFIDRLMDAIRTEVIPGLDEGDLRRELEAITGLEVEAA